MTQAPPPPTAPSARVSVAWGCTSCETSETAQTSDPHWLARARAFLVQHERCLTTVTLPQASASASASASAEIAATA